MRSIIAISLSLLVLRMTASFLPAAERVAFVIGNDAYPTAPLQNAVRDATAVNAMLRTKLNFADEDVIFATDTDRIGFFEQFEKFKKAAAGAEIVLVYYAGHGMESLDGKENFIIPVDADVMRAVESEAALRATGINLMTLSADLAGATNGAKVVLMDCCRQRPAGRALGSRSGGGLNVYEDKRIPADTLMILAAAPNRLASDGADHGPFTEALLEVLPRGGQNLMDAFFDVSDRVQEVTKKSQVPWLKFDGSGRIFRKQTFLAVTAVPTEATPMKLPNIANTSNFAATRSTLASATREKPFVNDLGMKFVPVMTDGSGKKVLFSIWETRVQDYAAYASANPAELNMEWKDYEYKGHTQESDHPVVNVSWEEALDFAKWLTETDRKAGRIGGGDEYRLPTDVEWSHAVGIGDREEASALPEDKDGKIEGVYPWGTTWPPPPNTGNFSSDEAEAAFDIAGIDGGYKDGHAFTAPVGTYGANRFGIYDLGGNVCEWCNDWYSDIPKHRVLRGGSWYTNTYFTLRSSYRFRPRPSGRGNDNGVRLVVVSRAGD